MHTTASLFESSPKNINSKDSGDGKAYLFITLIWVAMTSLVNPIGNFPLNDDWAYAASVKTLIETGNFIFPDWSAANILTQIFWGALACKLFGFSFTVLRLSTLALSLVGLITAYKIIRYLNINKFIGIIAVLGIAVNPIYFISSNTFMTEVPFLAFSLLALLFLTQTIQRFDFARFFLGIFFATLALMVRQLGFAIPIAFIFAFIFGRPTSWKNIVFSILPLVVCVVAHFSFKMWLLEDGQKPTMYGYQISQISENLSRPFIFIAKNYIFNSINSVLYISLGVLPVSLVTIYFKRFSVKSGICALIAITTIWFVFHQYWIFQWPIIGNLINTFGAGPKLQHGSIDDLRHSITYLSFFWNAISYIALVSLFLFLLSIIQLIHSIWQSLNEKDYQSIRLPLFFIITTVIYMIPVVGVEYMFDRYLLLPILTVTLLLLSTRIVQKTNIFLKLQHTSAAIILIGIGIISITITHDYLSWNRVRWQVLNELVEVRKIQPERIDGGFEFNGMYLYNPSEIKIGAKGWWVSDNEWLISLEYKQKLMSEGYKVVERRLTDSWLPFSPRYIYLLHKS